MKFETYDKMMKDNFVPICFEAFHFLKENFHNVSKAKDEQLVESHTVSLEPMENRLQ